MRRLILSLAAGALLATAVVWTTQMGPSATPRTTATPTPSQAERGPAVATPAPTLQQMAMWSRGDLLVEVAEQAAALDGVVATTHVRSDTLGLVGSRRADGTVVEGHTDGWRVPVGVGAIDPDDADALMLADDAGATVAALVPGQVLLTQTGADLRGVGVGGHIDLDGRPDLVVAGIVPDGAVGRAEIVVHVDDADDVGLEEDGTLLLVHRREDADALADEVQALAPADAATRVVIPGDDERAGRTPLVLPLPALKARFGEFAYRPRPGTRDVDIDPDWMAENLEIAEVPILGSVWCHRKMIPDLRTALQAVVDAGLASTIDPDDYSGCFVARRIGTDTTSLSSHAWGIAVDINVDLSLPGLGPPPDPGVVDAFEAAGFRWGGDFLTPDNHHFEWVGTDAA